MNIFVLIWVVVMSTAVAKAQNLLINGNFNSPAAAGAPDSWNLWSFGPSPGDAWSNREVPMLIDNGIDNTGIYDGSFQMTFGGKVAGLTGAGAYQIVAASAGVSFSLTVDAGAQAWWLPHAEIRLFFLDSLDTQLDSTVITATDSIHGPDLYDVGVPYQRWQLDAAAPAGTTQAKVEFAGYGGGSAWFDNASLTVIPEPGTAGLFALSLVFVWGVRSRQAA